MQVKPAVIEYERTCPAANKVACSEGDVKGTFSFPVTGCCVPLFVLHSAMEPVLKYFQAEKVYCIFGACFAALSLVVALYFLLSVRQPFYSGMAYPFLVMGLFFLVICTTVAHRAPADIARVTSFITENRSLIREQELPRMNNVMTSFRIIIVIELVLIVASVVVLIVLGDKSLIKGIFAGVLIHASFFLLFDLLAQQRAKEYLEFLGRQ